MMKHSARQKQNRGASFAVALAVAMGAPLLVSGPAVAASRIENPVAVFAALDKVTASISQLEVRLNETVQFGTLKITPRACYSRAPTEPPKTSTFVEVHDVTLNEGEKRIFTGWMFAESPGLNAVEHPVFDVWLTDCVGGEQGPAAARADEGETSETDPVRRRRRVRR